MVVNMALCERVFAEAKRLCYAGLDAPTLLRAVVDRVRRVVPFEAHCSFANDPLSGLLTHMVSDGAIGENQHRTYLEHVYFAEDFIAQRRMALSRVPVALLSDATRGALDRALRYREITGPLGLGFELLTVCAVGREQWGGVCLIRERGRPDFNAAEVALLQRIAPHLAAGLKAAALCAQVPVGTAGGDVPGVLVLDDRGRVVQHTEAAEQWLQQLGDLGSGWLDGIGLPAPVWMAVGAVRRALRSETERDLESVPRVHVRTPTGRWLTLHGAQTASTSDHAGETMIIVEPTRPRELAWLRASAYGLSTRERAVVDRVAQGDSTKEIARALFISEYTVQEHLSHAFDKIGVRGRRALVERLFFDQLYPAWCATAEESAMTSP